MFWDKVKRGYRVFQIVWMACCVLLLALCLVHANSPDNRDNGIVLILVMLALTFPTGWLAVLALTYCIPWSANAYINLPITWATFFVAGCAQWIGLIPLLIRAVSRYFPGLGPTEKIMTLNLSNGPTADGHDNGSDQISQH